MRVGCGHVHRRWIVCCGGGAKGLGRVASAADHGSARTFASLAPLRGFSIRQTHTMHTAHRFTHNHVDDFDDASFERQSWRSARDTRIDAAQGRAVEEELAAPWRKLTRCVTESHCVREEGQTPEMGSLLSPSLVDAARLRSCLPQLYALWAHTYHPIFTPHPTELPERDKGAAVGPSAVGVVAAPTSAFAAAMPAAAAARQLEHLIPEEAEGLPLLVQALGHLARAVQSIIEDCVKGVPWPSPREPIHLHDLYEWRVEVQAMLLYLGRYRLRHLVPVSFTQHMHAREAFAAGHNDDEQKDTCLEVPMGAGIDALSSEHNVASLPLADGERTVLLCSTTHASLGMKMHDSPLSCVQKEVIPRAHAAPSLPLRPLPYRTPIQHLALPLPADELLRVVALVKAAQVILDVAQPSAVASTVRAELYLVLLSVVGASEQLSSATLASLTTCLARCADGYATCQLLSCARLDSAVAVQSSMDNINSRLGCNVNSCADEEPTRLNDSAAAPYAEDEDRHLLRSFLRPVQPAALPSPRDFVILPSPQEKREAAALAEMRGGLGPRLRPTAVLHHFRVLANVAQHRIARVLLRGKQMLPQRESAMASLPALGEAHRHNTRESTPLAAGAARAVLEVKMKEGLLGLLPLQERKAREMRGMGEKAKLHRPQSAGRQRRTVAALATSAATVAATSADDAIEADDRCSSLPSRSSGVQKTHDTVTAEAPSVPARSLLQQTRHRSDSLSGLNAIECVSESISLTDAAEICSAMAALGFRGDSDPAEESFWSNIVDFTCVEIMSVGKAVRHAAVETVGTAAEDTVAQHTVVEQMLRDTRDVCFAVDRVGFTSGYDRIMEALVRQGLLSEPILAPSVGRRCMPDISV